MFQADFRLIKEIEIEAPNFQNRKLRTPKYQQYAKRQKNLVLKISPENFSPRKIKLQKICPLVDMVGRRLDGSESS